MKNTKIKNTRLARVLKRLLGEENGAVAMEYVIIGLLIAAAAVAAVSFFGQTISDSMNTMSVATTGQHSDAALAAEDNQKRAKSDADEASSQSTRIRGGDDNSASHTFGGSE